MFYEFVRQKMNTFSECSLERKMDFDSMEVCVFFFVCGLWWVGDWMQKI